jgi:predicted nucleotidyltransferase
MSEANVQLKEAETSEILRVEVGSTIHGVSVDAQDDLDLLGVYMEPKECVLGLRLSESVTFRTAPKGERSKPGDVDLVIHSLRKFCQLASRGNPSILLALYSPKIYKAHPIALDLRQKHGMFFSKVALHAYLGYMQSQRERLTGERGQKRTNRPELIEKYGYDTKYAGHLIRLGLQGIEYADTGKLELPMKRASEVIAIRTGKVSEKEVVEFSRHLEADLEDRLDSPGIPPMANYAMINDFLVRAQEEWWSYFTAFPAWYCTVCKLGNFYTSIDCQHCNTPKL